MAALSSEPLSFGRKKIPGSSCLAFSWLQEKSALRWPANVRVSAEK
jgi:hypothetical protein